MMHFPGPPPFGPGRGNGPPRTPGPGPPDDWQRPPFAGPRHAGPRMPPRPPGIRPIMRDTPQWDAVHQEADHWKKQGNLAMKNEDYHSAMSFYEIAVNAAMTIPCNERQVASIHSNRSFACLKVGIPDHALRTAQMVVDVNPKWYKGYFRMAEALMAQGLPGEAFEALGRAFVECQMKPEQELELTVRALVFADLIPGGRSKIRKLRVKPAVWTGLLTSAVNSDSWNTVRFLMLGDDAKPSSVACDLANVHQITHLVKNSTDADLTEWGQKLILAMLKKGLPLKSLEEPERSALHVALEVGMRTHCFDLLRQLLKNDITRPHERSVGDSHGNTLLHVVAMATMDPAERIDVIDLLLSRSLDPCAQNNDGKFAADYVRKNDPSYRQLRPADSREHEKMQQLKDRGNAFLKRNKLDLALEMYTEALKVVPDNANLRKQIQITLREVAQLHSNRATVLLRQDRLVEAHASAEECIRVDRDWFKGHVRLGKVLEKQNKSSNALYAYKRAFTCMMAANLEDDLIKVEILTDMASLHKFTAEAKKCLSDCKASPDVWRKVIERVLRKDDIRSLLMLVTSRFTKRCDLGSLDYIPLMRHARESISSMSDFEKSVMGILDRDGSHEYLGTGDMGPLHISMLISKHSESCQLFKYLLEKRITHSSEINERDLHGDTLLHLLITHKIIDLPHGYALLNLLMTYGYDCSLLDAEGHTAGEYLPADHPARDTICKYLACQMNQTSAPPAQAAKPQRTKKSRKQANEPVLKPAPTQVAPPQPEPSYGVCQRLYESAQKQRENCGRALTTLCEIFGADHPTEEHECFAEKARDDIFDIIVNSASDVSTDDLVKVTNELSHVIGDLARCGNWQKVREMLSALKDMDMESNRLACHVDVAKFVDGCYNRGNNRRRRELLNLLLDCGSPPDGTESSSVTVAFQNRDSSSLSCLLAKGAALRGLDTENGDTPLHAALNVALQAGNFDLINVLLDQPDLDVSVCDASGNTLFHCAACVPYSKHALRAVEILSGTSCNPNIRNHSGRTAVECLTGKGRKNDRRSQYIKMSAKKFPTSVNAAKKPKKTQNDSQCQDSAKVDLNCNGVDTKCVTNADEWEKGHVTLKKVTNQREVCRHHIVDMIENLPDPGCPEQRAADPALLGDRDSSNDGDVSGRCTSSDSRNDDSSNHGDVDDGVSCSDDASNHSDVDDGVSCNDESSNHGDVDDGFSCSDESSNHGDVDDGVSCNDDTSNHTDVDDGVSCNEDASNHGDIDERSVDSDSCNDDASYHSDVDERSVDSDSCNDDASNHGDTNERGTDSDSCSDDTSCYSDVDETSANKNSDATASAKSEELRDDSKPCNDDTNDGVDDRNRDTDESSDAADTDASLSEDDGAAEAVDNAAMQISDDDDDDDVNDDVDDNDDIDPSVFDDLVWEVECTADVWKLLKDKRVLEFVKRRSISKIQRLASGDWTRGLAKKLDHIPSDIQLYEAKLSKGARILWELAVAFSPRRSEDADRRLGANKSVVKGGCIYSEVIRVWHIVLRHDNLQKVIDRVVRSHNRGSDCILQKRLRGIVRQKFHTGSGVVNQRVPILYLEIDDDDGCSDVKDGAMAAQPYFPPASPNETEYHVMKFYAFTSTLVSNILADQGMKVDFPFRVTELEHAIIHLQPRPPTAILLLGRSGTGKTTCCVYRLWSAFVRYWEKAGAAGAPLMPRKMYYTQKEGSDSGERCEETSKSVVVSNGARSEASLVSETPGWDHLHQVFVTKNPVLCSEVQKNFCNLSHASDVADHHTAVELDDLPARMQDVRADAFPLFLTMRHLLLMLDGSMPAPFFEREPDGGLSREVAGWGDDNNQLSFIPDVFFDDDDDVALLEDVPGDNPQSHESRRKRIDPRREVTYEIFVHELWPKMNKKLQVDCHATLVWMEIRSFIQGSFEALLSDTGYLSLDGYLLLGRKRAANFSSDRSAIYDLYREYRRLKQNLAMYDENDLVYHLYHRLTTADGAAPKWVIHEFYVDETQDFTQAELCLLIRCSADPNATFFTGDTAQSIMRGIAFRFEDLRSLFYYVRDSFRCRDKTSTIQVPRLYQLTHNYRSHAGILALAASIVDLMLKFFPNSFDRLEKDCGLFDGPKPVLLESCSVSDLALLLRGSQRQTSQIEFGAHQAILVANDQARDHIPEELSLGLVLTIFEAKGLEFDDILIYNFFKDSQASQEWRVVTDHLNSLLEQKQTDGTTGSHNGIVEIDQSVLDTDDRPRPLTFDLDQHKVLNSELKYLYTAVTRARVNVWIFDEDANARAPMFEYFRACHLVEVVTQEGTDASQQELPDRVFAEASTCHQWRHRGDEFYKHHLYNVAAKCYMKSGDVDKEKMSRAQQRALEASRLRDNPRRLRHEFLFAAEGYLECGMTVEAAKCLCNAKETLLAARLYEKMGQSHHAVALYKRMDRMDEASQAYENDSKYGQAVELLVSNKLFDKAIDVVCRYHIKVQEYEAQGLPVPQKILANRPGPETRSVKQLCLEAAKFHHQGGRSDDMLASLDRLLDVTDKIQFLLQRGHVTLAAPIMAQNGREAEAAEAFYRAGDLEMALQYASSETQLSFRAECLLSASRHVLNRDSEISDDEWSRAKEYLVQALSLFEVIGERLGKESAEAKLLLGHSAEAKLLLSEDLIMVTEAYTTFHELRNDIGQIMCLKVLLVEGDDFASSSKCIDYLQMLFDLVESLEGAQNAFEKEQTRHVRSFYGLQATEEPHVYRVMPGQGARISRALPPAKALHASTLKEKQAHGYIISDLVLMAVGMVDAVRGRTVHMLRGNRMCEQYSSGLECKVSGCLHYVPSRDQRRDLTVAVMWLVQLNVLIATTLKRPFMGKIAASDRSILKDLDDKTPDELLQDFYEIMFPVDGHVSYSASGLVQEMRDNACMRRRMMRFTEECVWKRMEHKDRQANTDHLIMIHSVRLVCEPNPENMLGLLLREEKWFKVEEARKSRSAPRLGIHKTHDGGLIYFRKYIESAVHLYRKCDPVESFACLNMLLDFTARHPREPLLPSIANTAMLLEQQLVLAACLNLRFRDSPAVFLPESYLSAVDFRDVLHSSRGATGGLYDSVHRYSGRRLTTGRVDYLARLMCGCVAKNFDMFTDVFDSDDAIKSGACERVLILVLVMLSNAGPSRPVSVASENLLRKRLAEVRCTDVSNFPARLAVALGEVTAAGCKRDVVIALVHLLESRDPNEPLRRCVWNRARGGLTARQVADVSDICDNRNYEPAVPTATRQTSNADVDNLGAAEVDPEDNPGTDLFSDAYMNQARMDQERLDEGIALHLAADDAPNLTVAPQPQQSMSNPLSDFIIDDTLCQFCYMVFTPGGNERIPHEMSVNHIEKQQQFDVYKACFLEDMQPMLNEANAYLDISILNAQLSEAVKLLLAAKKDVEDHRHWHKLDEMKEAAGALRACLGEAKVTMDRIQKEEQQRTRREADTQAALGEDTAALLADDDQYRDDEAGPILDVAVGPRQREARRRGRQYRRRAGGRTDGRRN